MNCYIDRLALSENKIRKDRAMLGQETLFTVLVYKRYNKTDDALWDHHKSDHLTSDVYQRPFFANIYYAKLLTAF